MKHHFDKLISDIEKIVECPPIDIIITGGPD